MTIRINKADQWYLYWLWIRHSYSFRWAHKPLCDRFHQDTITICTVHLCRGCAFLYLGLILTFLFAYPFSTYSELLPYILISLSAIVLPASYPAVYQSLPRILKDMLRLMLGSLVSICVITLVSGYSAIGMCSLILLYFYRRGINKVRATIKLNACHGCPELDGKHVCSGYRLQVNHQLHYEQEASEWVMNEVNSLKS